MNIIDNIYDNIFNNIYKNINYQYDPPLYEDYSLYIDFTKSLIDQVSNQTLDISGLAAGRVGYDGTEAGINEALIEDDGALFYGAYDGTLTYDYTLPVAPGLVPENNSSTDRGVKAEYSEMLQLLDALDGIAGDNFISLEDSSWVVVVHASSLDGILTFDNVAGGTPLLAQLPNTGFDASSFYQVEYEVFSNPDSCRLFLSGSGFCASTELDMSVGEHTKRVLCTIEDGKARFAGSSTVLGVITMSLFSISKIATAEGKLTLTWRPMYNASEVTGTVNILTTDDDTTNTLHYDADNNMLKLTDGTNTSSIACTPVADTEYSIVGNWNEIGGLQIRLDSVDGSLASFAGRFPTEDEMSYAWEADAPQYIKITSIKKESDF